MLLTFDGFIYRAVQSTLIKLLLSLWQIMPLFESFYYDVPMFIAYIVCFVARLDFNFICPWSVTLYFAICSHFSATYQFYGFIHDLFLHFYYAC